MIESFDGYAFALGMVALINPCGFALLPAYLGLFLGLEDGAQSRLVALGKAQMVGISLSAGFLVVFGLLGVVFAGVYGKIAASLPWANLVIGAALVLLGLFMLGGLELAVAVPKLGKGGSSGSVKSMFLFGVSYAIASLSCTIPLFLGVVGTSSAGRNFGDRLGSFVSYSVGMGLLATTLTLALALAKDSFILRFRSLLPKINLVSALVLVVVGFYVALYGVWSIQVLGGNNPPDWLDSFVLGAERLQTGLATAVNSRSAVLGWAFVSINAIIVMAGLVERKISQKPVTNA